MLGPSDIALYYQSLRLPPRLIEEVEQMRREAPARSVGVHALNNLRVDLYSRCNGERRKLESYTCEAAYALETEISGRALAYWSQVGLKGIRRGGRIHTATTDFMLFEPDGIRIVECKPVDVLERLAEKKPDEWQLTPNGWRRPPLEEWCKERSFRYEIWSPPRPHGIYLANLTVMFGALAEQLSASEERSLGRLSRILAAGPRSLADALGESGATFKVAVQALAKGTIFGTLKSRLIDDAEHFELFPSQEHAALADQHLLELLRGSYQAPSVQSRLLSATQTDYSKGKTRLERVRGMLEGKEPVTRRFSKLVKAVLRAMSDGTSPLEECLTLYHLSGRRVRQLTHAQEDELSKAVVLYQRSPHIKGISQLHRKLRDACLARGCRAPCESTLRERLRQAGPERRALSTGGKRKYHSVKQPVDPSGRTVDANVPFLKVHVDSTKFDNRSLPYNLGLALGPMCPVLYIAVDAATGLVVGRALVFGNACRDAFAILIRDIVWRYGRLPLFWVADGGSEYTGPWFGGFCTSTGASRIQPPSGAPRHNSIAENVLGRINRQVAHHLTGSTDPDKCGRKVDAKFKSYRTARHSFATLVKELDAFLFEDLPHTPVGIRPGTPREHYEDLLSVVGEGGLSAKYDDDFRILTSIPLDRDVKVVWDKGIRHEGRTYSSAALFEALTSGQQPTEKRRDCADPSLMFVKFGTRWISASSADSMRIRSLTEQERLFELMMGRKNRADSRERREEIKDERYRRIDLANASVPATQHLVVPTDDAKSTVTTASPWTSDSDLEPFNYERP